MKLKTVEITNFRSAEESELFEVGQVTCLVGKNEAGKSAVLLALAALNPHPATPATLDKERDYPRRFLAQFDQRHKTDRARAVTTTWSLDDEEIADIAYAIGEGTLTSNEVTIFRDYGYSVDTEISLSFNHALEFLYSKFKLDASERSVLFGVDTTSKLIEKLKNIASPTEKHKALQVHLSEHGIVTAQAKKIVLSMLPKFMYFSSYDRMDGAIQIENASALIANNTIGDDLNRGIRLFTEFLDYSNVSMEEIVKVATYETFDARLQAASNNITDQILEYWTQNPDLSVVVRIEAARPGDPPPLNTGTIARARIHNDLHRVDTPFSERSAGFVWFFSFLVKFAQVKDESHPVVLLLDEPGLTLHGKAQADLLRFFREKLSPHHQIIYSTHSPFMVPADDLASIRIVEDQVDTSGVRRKPLGTKVRQDILTRDPDTLFPLQGALGYDISQSLFVGKNTLLVEGPGDIIYLHALSDALRRRKRTPLDPRWTLCPAGGIDKIRPFVSLFAGNTLNVAVLSDQAVGDKRKIEDLKRSQVLKSGHFYSVADFLSRGEADIEDIFDPELYASILNGCYDLSGALTLSAITLHAAAPETVRLVKQAEAAFAVMPPTVDIFDHYAPAFWLLKNPATLDEDSKAINETLDRAEEIMRAYNSLL